MDMRKTLLYGGLAVVAFFYGGDMAYRKLYEEPMMASEAQLLGLQRDLNDGRQRLVELTRGVEALDILQQRALPRDLELARSVYQGWLVQLVQDAEFQSPRVDSVDPVTRTYRKQTLYHSLSFTLRGRGNLSQITKLMFEFYRAGHLHKIRTFSLIPVGTSEQLDVSLSIEALALTGADRNDSLTALQSERLASSELDAYQSIARRNLFGAGGNFQLGRMIILSAVTSDVKGVPEAWFSDRRRGLTHVLQVGDTLSSGMVQATLLHVLDDSTIIEMDGQLLQLPIGASLAEATVTELSVAQEATPDQEEG